MSPSVNELMLPAPPLRPPMRLVPPHTSMRLLPRLAMVLSSSAWVPWPTETMMITAAMPMITPSAVSTLRIQLPRTANIAISAMSVNPTRCGFADCGQGPLAATDLFMR